MTERISVGIDNQRYINFKGTSHVVCGEQGSVYDIEKTGDIVPVEKCENCPTLPECPVFRQEEASDVISVQLPYYELSENARRINVGIK